ncbi:MAG: pirin family protein [Candidatus Marinimicrobia bacterium]|jgi:redox-sensitive bicupin YhaK (pirin superfamily)|nr:pirin family protein [Candidatus Neomarinimicrobiota bacterium]MDG2367328.1 pirin family protein [Candidatus Neomarinimicrobiota bacterium]
MKRYIQTIIEGIQTSDGAGVNLRRIIGSPELNMLDPFLLLDEFGSEDPNDYIAGFPPHPHRGFETITYMLNGKFRHKDSAGNEGFLSDGSVQWMTAGKGVIHSEMPEQTDGLIKGFQLWLNLPKEKKMISPKYNDINADQIPCINFDGGNVKIISGEFSGVTGPGEPHTGMLYFDIHLDAKSELILPIENGWNGFIYVYDGKINILDKEINKKYLAVLSQDGELILHTKEHEGRFILVAGEPLNEPVARGGPFVMNTKGEILKAFSDYQEGKFA